MVILRVCHIYSFQLNNLVIVDKFRKIRSQTNKKKHIIYNTKTFPQKNDEFSTKKKKKKVTNIKCYKESLGFIAVTSRKTSVILF